MGGDRPAAALGVALVFLLRSMNKQLHKITPAPGAADDHDVTDPPSPAE